MGIDIHAPADLVFHLASDPRAWPDLLPHYVRAKPLSRAGQQMLVEFVARRPLVPVLGLGMPVAWRSRTWADPDRRELHFHHVGGATAGMDVTWRIESSGQGSRVTIEHVFAPRWAPWGKFVDSLFTRPIAARTLRGFRSIAEAVALRDGGAGLHGE